MKANIEIVPFDGIWGSYARLLNHGKIVLPDRPLSALDLGCGPGYPLFVLYHDHGFSSLTGVDLLSESGVLVQEKRHLPAENRTPNQELLWHCNSIYELYRLVMQPERSRIHKVSLQPLEFYQHFNFVWEQNLRQYLYDLDTNDSSEIGSPPAAIQNGGHSVREGSPRFDVVILSNVLHFQPWQEAKELVGKAASKLNKGGVLWVRVYHEGSEKFTGNGFVSTGSSGLSGSSGPTGLSGLSGDAPSSDEPAQRQFTKNGERYWVYNKDLFLGLFEGLDVLAFEGVLNSRGPGYKFLTAVLIKQ